MLDFNEEHKKQVARMLDLQNKIVDSEIRNKIEDVDKLKMIEEDKLSKFEEFYTELEAKYELKLKQEYKDYVYINWIPKSWKNNIEVVDTTKTQELPTIIQDEL